jgi:hypothetical protein
MPRFDISRSFVRKIRFYQQFDVYTCKHLYASERTIEHIIPARLFTNKNDQWNGLNLYTTDLYLNRFRSDFVFGGSVDEVHSELGLWKQLDGNYKNLSKRVFLPKNNHRLIAHTVWTMLDQQNLDFEIKDCFESEEKFYKWLKIPWTSFELECLEKNKFYSK